MGLLLLTFASIRSSFCPCRFFRPTGSSQGTVPETIPPPRPFPTWLIGLTYYTTFPWIMVAPCAKKAKNTLPQYGVIISFLALFFNRFLALFPFSSVFYNPGKVFPFLPYPAQSSYLRQIGRLGPMPAELRHPGVQGRGHNFAKMRQTPAHRMDVSGGRPRRTKRR